MVDKSSFTAEEWVKVRGSVLATGLAVSLAEPGGLIGMLKEGFASAKDLMEAKQSTDASALIKAIVADLETSEGRTSARAELKAMIGSKSPADAKAAALAEIVEGARIVNAKSPWEAAGYKVWLRKIAQDVAEAASEGGFLGFGGTQVTQNERATLDEISKALG